MATLNENVEKTLTEKLKTAIKQNDTTLVRRLIKGGVDPNATYWYDVPILHEATSTGDVSMVKLLLDAKAKVNAQNREGRTALHVAARLGKMDVVRELVKSGARVNAETEDYKTSLHVASWRGHEDIVRYLVKSGADVNRPDLDGTTAMHWAAKHNKKELAEFLINSGAKISLGDSLNRGPILLAAQAGNEDVIQLLLRHGADLNQRTKDKSRLLPYILDNKKPFSEDLAELLLIAGANPQGVFTTIRSQDPPETKRLKSVILHYQYSVPKLIDIARVYIRRQLSKANRGRSITIDVYELPLPTLMKEFVLLKPDFDRLEDVAKSNDGVLECYSNSRNNIDPHGDYGVLFIDDDEEL